MYTKFIDSLGKIFKNPYLQERKHVNIVEIFFACLLFSQLKLPNKDLINNVGFKNAFNWQSVLLVLVLISSLFLLYRGKRWLIYLAMTLSVVVFFASYVAFAYGNQYLGADRDTAFMISTHSFLAEQNPWKDKTQLGGEIDTGPTSILIGAPIVAATGSSLLLNLIFWLTIAFIMLVGDIKNKNNSFVLISMIMLNPIFGFAPNIFWSLSEFYYAIPFFVFSWMAVEKKNFLLAGVLIAAAINVRLFYVFPSMAFFVWMIINNRVELRNLIRFSFGAIFGTLVILLPFYIISGNSFWQHNPFLPAIKLSGQSSWQNSNIVNVFLDYIMGQSKMLSEIFKVAILLLPIVIISSKLRDSSAQKNPLLVIGIASFITLNFIWSPNNFGDYLLAYVIPLMLAYLLSENLNFFEEVRVEK